MFDAKRLLDQFLGGQQPGQHNTGSGPGGFDLSQIGGMLGGQGGQSGSGPLAGLGGLGGLGGGALAGGLATMLLGSKKGRKFGGEALKIGGMAVAGALAYKAYRNWQAGQNPALPQTQQAPALPPPAGTPFNPSTESEQQALARNLLRAMIAAAKADGHVDSTEQANIFAQMDKLPLDAEDKAFVMDELRAPLDVDSVARAARTPEEAAEIYAVSLLAIDVDNAAERGYLALLAARLGLEDGLVQHLHATIEGETKPA